MMSNKNEWYKIVLRIVPWIIAHIGLGITCIGISLMRGIYAGVEYWKYNAEI